ncbi:DUF1834 family protein [Alishewanella sp. 16-MA]|uniref:DUF1834 family protein n=1 Tax=Alishewanella maricola TaxID=2795740 RepID=A0ABS8C2F1_9ALTE|nr:DUF1834 family protein [Alishewanella maricola]MCB5226175.1 DUF1834 family protein [Alishewanella maricola]
MHDIGDNYLAAEQHLIEVAKTVTGFRQVCSTNDLAEVEERSQVSPACHVIYFGDAVPEIAQGGTYSHVTQTWLLIIVVRQGRGQTPNQEAGQLIKQLLVALHSNSLVDGKHVLTRVNSPAKPRYTKGHAYYPLAFNVKFRLKA